MNKELIEQYNRVNNFIGSLNSVTDTTTMHLVIAKFSFTILVATGKLTDTMDAAAKLKVVNDAVEDITNNLILDRARLKNFLIKKVEHHFNKTVEELFYCKSLNGMSTDYGEINKDLDFSNISAPLVVILKDVL